jgi:glycolate oxidase FAD binding subunit
LVSGLPDFVSQRHGTVGGLVACALPHALWSQCGGVRDWVLGMTVVRTDGTVAKSGSKAVKSVAGYDAHKLFVGSRGTLGAVASVVLRTFPLRALPAHGVEVVGEGEPRYVARTLRSDFERARSESGRLVAFDAASCTLWSMDEPLVSDEGWMVGLAGLVRRPSQPAQLEHRARQVFDPRCKLAPGWAE